MTFKISPGPVEFRACPSWPMHLGACHGLPIPKRFITSRMVLNLIHLAARFAPDQTKKEHDDLM